MARRKRAAILQAEQDIPRAKRVRITRASSQPQPTPAICPVDERIEDQTPPRSDDLTSLNARESPLLRLPAELRERIWAYAFGMKTVHPRGNRARFWDTSPERSRKWPVTFTPCNEEYSDCEVYQMSLQGAMDGSPHFWKHPDMMNTNWDVTHHRGLHLCSRWAPQIPPGGEQQFVPLICKQLYYEALPVAWKTITFSFMESGYFQHFLRSPYTRFDLVTQLCIIQLSNCGEPYWAAWASALKSPMMLKFTALQGLNLVLRNHDYRSWDRPTPSVSDIMKTPPYYCKILPTIIRQFQRYPLEKNKTTVLITSHYWENDGGDYTGFPVTDRRIMAEVIRSHLLQTTNKMPKPPKWMQNTIGTRRSVRLNGTK
ncbi:hypothetical protein BKA66DRAFT_576626 [Pyrenochaeta sp. MPI-SDFR-AT-0127]|nr:hypothetical protein BKA66DRAFT_576626 [Pyrenochaeta sp. MPI-SDFR-AT-0127]